MFWYDKGSLQYDSEAYVRNHATRHPHKKNKKVSVVDVEGQSHFTQVIALFVCGVIHQSMFSPLGDLAGLIMILENIVVVDQRFMNMLNEKREQNKAGW